MEKLEIPKSKWSSYTKQAQEIQLNIEECKALKATAFLGTPVPTNKGTVLTDTMLTQLTVLNVQPQGLAYEKGIVSLRTKTHESFDLVEFHNLLDKQLKAIESNVQLKAWLDELIHTAKLIQILLTEYLYLTHSTDFVLLIKEQNRIYAQIACALLPVTFLQIIQAPMFFVEFVAPQLGRYLAYRYCYEDRSNSSLLYS